MTDLWLDDSTETEVRWLGALWGKSDHGKGWHLLIQHLLDALAVGEQLWDGYLAPNVKDRLDAATEGRGRSFIAWLCGLHDLGKASPAFQSQDATLAAQVRAAGLPIERLRPREHQDWRHDRAGAHTLLRVLHERWPQHHIDWVWPLVAGHHGVFPPGDRVGRRLKDHRDTPRLHGAGAWEDAREHLLDLVTRAAGYGSVSAVQPVERPARPDQLALSGFVVMADWISSNDGLFEPIGDLRSAGPDTARQRAGHGWGELAITGGWGRLGAAPDDPVEARFGTASRASQRLVVDTARVMARPGLLLVEAPMGEGKTEAALAAAEVFAERFGVDGIALGMPTQATADPMLDRLEPWFAQLAPGLQVALVHGRTRFTGTWQRLLTRRPESPDRDETADVDSRDAFGCDDDYGDLGRFTGIGEDCSTADRYDCGDPVAAASWLLASKRGLLAGQVICTVDQLLYAATRSRFVALRYAGLAGKVVVLDEVHAADEYMTEFLVELLSWLGAGQVPVVLLTATLAPRQRERLVAAYLGGAIGDPARGDRPDEPRPLPGYPAVTACWADGEAERRVEATCQPWRPSISVSIALTSEDPSDPDAAVATALDDALVVGGVALVIRNTVARAQATYRALVQRYGDDVVLLHSRFTAADRASTSGRLLDELGRTGPRPLRRIVVATQIAEQSFDIDADLLVSDVAPVDLLLQRIGRLHRHQRGHGVRPSPVAEPQVVLTGFTSGDPVPTFPGGSIAIYGCHRLLRALALAAGAERSGWPIPAQVPDLVATAYADVPSIPLAWAEVEAQTRARWDQEKATSASVARSYRLAPDGERSAPTLAGLHHGASRARDVEAHIHVREGDLGEELVLIRRVDGRLQTMEGHDLGVHGERGRDLGIDVLGGTVTVPARDTTLARAARERPTLPEWLDDPWLNDIHVLELDDGGRADLCGYSLHYDRTLGLTITTPKGGRA